MKYVPFNIGDWSSATRWLTATERGVYMDLITTYYETEKPLMRTQCERIANGYAQHERDALKKILDTFFVFNGESYSHKRCDEEISAYKEKSLNNSKAARIRWGKEKACERNADAVQTQCEWNAIQETRNKKQEVVVGDVAPTTSPPVKKVSKAKTFKFDKETISQDWEKLCRELRPDLDPQVVFNKFKFYWTKGARAGTLRGEKGWNQCWLNWISSEKETRPTAQATHACEEMTHDKADAMAFSFFCRFVDKMTNKIQWEKLPQDFLHALVSEGHRNLDSMRERLVDSIMNKDDLFYKTVKPVFNAAGYNL